MPRQSSWSALFFFFLLVTSFERALGRNQVLEKAIQESGIKENEASPDVAAVYEVARTWYDSGDRDEAVQVLHELADSQNHILSMAKLGHHYASVDENPGRAIQYFAMAGENGPHHPSLYNAGRMMAEFGEWVGALAYLRAAATLSESHPAEFIVEETTKTSKEVFAIVSHRVSKEELSIVQLADVFLFGSLQDLPEEAQSLWTDAVMGLMKFNQTFVETNGQTQDEEAMKTVTQALRQIWETYGIAGQLSDLQAYLLLDNMNDMLGPLAGLDDMYVPMAAGYAEGLAFHSVYCVEHFAVVEDDSACFNGATASAMSFYRRMGDGESAKRVLEGAQNHPKAATHWKFVEQTPRVFHPELTSKAWWEAEDFSAALSLQEAFKKYSKQILKELEDVKALQEGRLRGANDSPQVADIKANGSVEFDIAGDNKGGFQRIFTPYIGVRTEASKTKETGAGGWAEFGPLFDGVNWNENNCKLLPTVCEILKDDGSLCTARAKVDSTKNVWQLCGADTVVTVLRLRPGTTILPHCGTTNSRLIMHFALEGAEGVEFTVGGKTVKNYGGGDGHAIVFDDSFEHSVYHGGDKDRFVVLAVLAHPDLL